MKKLINIVVLLIIILAFSNCSNSNSSTKNLNSNWLLLPMTASPGTSYFTSLAVWSDSVYAVTGINSGVNIVMGNYDSGGISQWANSSATGPSYAYFSSIAAGSSNIYAAGIINGNGTYDFGNSKTVAGNYSGGNAVLVQYDALSGSAQWARTVLSGLAHSFFSTTAIGSDGVYAAGQIDGSGEFDFGIDQDHPLTVTGNYASGDNAVLVKYDFNGTPLWARSVTTGPLDSFITSVAVSSDGYIYAVGAIYGNQPYNFGTSGSPQPVTGNNSGANIVLIKYDSDGTALWAKSVTTGPANSYFTSVTVGSDGNIYASGFIYGNGTFDFGNSKQATGSNNGCNAVLVKYDTDGNTLWAISVTTGPAYSYFSSVAAGTGAIYAAGVITGTGTYDFGNSKTVAGSYNGGNIVLVKYDLSGIAQWARSVMTGPAFSYFSSVAVGSDGVYTTGLIHGNGTYNFGNSRTLTGTTNNYNPVLVKYDLNGTAQWAR